MAKKQHPKSTPLLTAICLSAIFIGCGDEVTEVTNVQEENAYVKSVSAYRNLPDCSDDNAGELYFVGDSSAIYFCNGKDWATLNGSDGKDGIDGQDGRDGIDGQDGRDGLDGQDGKDGIDGKDGESPVLFDEEGNYIPGTGDTISVVIKNYGKTITGLGDCTSEREGEVTRPESVVSSQYYICKSLSWLTATTHEYDTYKWADSTDGASKLGNVSQKMYVFDKTRWRAAVGAEVELGLCVENRNGEINKYFGIYFTCKDRLWAPSTLLEYDTYGKNCMENATIDSGRIHPHNKYLCDNGKFRFAKPMELAMNQGCTSYNKGERRMYQYSNYVCDPDLSIAFRDHWDNSWIAQRDSSGWSFDFDHINYGTIVDSRDGKVYKTVGIKDQLWMNENLQYAKSGSYCYHDSLKYCQEYGRVYKWAAIENVCPEGWHVPEIVEWEHLFYQSTSISRPNDYEEYGFNYSFGYDREENSVNGHITISWENSSCGWWSSTREDEIFYSWSSCWAGGGWGEASFDVNSEWSTMAKPVRCVKDPE